MRVSSLKNEGKQLLSVSQKYAL